MPTATTPLAIAPLLKAEHRALIDELMSPLAPAWFVIADDEGPALLAALDDVQARDYLICGCATADGARRVLELLQSLDLATATSAQTASAAAALAYAALALDQRDAAHVYLGIAQTADPNHSLAKLLAAGLAHDIAADAFRYAAANTRAEIENHND